MSDKPNNSHNFPVWDGNDEPLKPLPRPAVLEAPQFLRRTSDKPLPGYVPSRRWEDVWEESDEMFRKRIQDAVKGGKQS